MHAAVSSAKHGTPSLLVFLLQRTTATPHFLRAQGIERLLRFA